MLREIVIIDEALCDGCGLCLAACHEGAIQLVNGKARLVSEVLCDGLGACLGHCPRGAIRIEKREAQPFDEAAVSRHLAASSTGAASHRPEVIPVPVHAHHPAMGCPGNRFEQFGPVSHGPPATEPGVCPGSRFESPRSRVGSNNGRKTGSPEIETVSELTHWPVQLRLLSPAAPVLRGARILLAADCVPVAYAGFQQHMLRGRAVVIACPKLDDTSGYIEKLADILRINDPQELVVAHMEVPCCTGILMMAVEARRRSSRDTPIRDLVVSRDGQIIQDRVLPPECV